VDLPALGRGRERRGEADGRGGMERLPDQVRHDLACTFRILDAEQLRLRLLQPRMSRLRPDEPGLGPRRRGWTDQSAGRRAIDAAVHLVARLARRRLVAL